MGWRHRGAQSTPDPAAEHVGDPSNGLYYGEGVPRGLSARTVLHKELWRSVLGMRLSRVDDEDARHRWKWDVLLIRGSKAKKEPPTSDMTDQINAHLADQRLVCARTSSGRLSDGGSGDTEGISCRRGAIDRQHAWHGCRTLPSRQC